ncbi:hypothetical protein SteCoe_15846 [Stentor coeruleus]|uniref:Uncharacterized protein n=1 Tax=Stentor coeruleus TaxID=5963 RepID=A0A1R2C2K7_9CILI|nr:hypothetical protein SteCoe_15846 [Stentor coeruleus]
MSNKHFPIQQGEQIREIIINLAEKYSIPLEESSKSRLYKKNLSLIKHGMLTIIHNYCRNLVIDHKENFPYIKNQDLLENVKYERVNLSKKEKTQENYIMVNQLVKNAIVETETQKVLEPKGKISQSMQETDEVSQAFFEEYENTNNAYNEKIQNIIEFISQNSYECPSSKKENPEEIYFLKHLTSGPIDLTSLQSGNLGNII